MEETFYNQKKIEEIWPVGDAGEWWHIAGAENPADRPSRRVGEHDGGGGGDFNKSA